MEDNTIVELFIKRDETAINRTQEKYGRYLVKVAYNILADLEDSKESVNDTYLKAWNSIPPQKPSVLSTYLAKITRQTAIDIFRKKNCKKRINSEYALSLSELEECFSQGKTPEQETELQMLSNAIGDYLKKLNQQSREVFVCRYFFMDSIRDIAAFQSCSEAKIKSILFRTRNGLKAYLEKEGYFL